MSYPSFRRGRETLPHDKDVQHGYYARSGPSTYAVDQRRVRQLYGAPIVANTSANANARIHSTANTNIRSTSNTHNHNHAHANRSSSYNQAHTSTPSTFSTFSPFPPFTPSRSAPSVYRQSHHRVHSSPVKHRYEYGTQEWSPPRLDDGARDARQALRRLSSPDGPRLQQQHHHHHHHQQQQHQRFRLPSFKDAFPSMEGEEDTLPVLLPSLSDFDYGLTPSEMMSDAPIPADSEAEPVWDEDDVEQEQDQDEVDERDSDSEVSVVLSSQGPSPGPRRFSTSDERGRPPPLAFASRSSRMWFPPLPTKEDEASLVAALLDLRRSRPDSDSTPGPELPRPRPSSSLPPLRRGSSELSCPSLSPTTSALPSSSAFSSPTSSLASPLHEQPLLFKSEDVLPVLKVEHSSAVCTPKPETSSRDSGRSSHGSSSSSRRESRDPLPSSSCGHSRAASITALASEVSPACSPPVLDAVRDDVVPKFHSHSTADHGDSGAKEEDTDTAIDARMDVDVDGAEPITSMMSTTATTTRLEADATLPTLEAHDEPQFVAPAEPAAKIATPRSSPSASPSPAETASREHVATLELGERVQQEMEMEMEKEREREAGASHRQSSAPPAEIESIPSISAEEDAEADAELGTGAGSQDVHVSAFGSQEVETAHSPIGTASPLAAAIVIEVGADVDAVDDAVAALELELEMDVSSNSVIPTLSNLSEAPVPPPTMRASTPVSSALSILVEETLATPPSMTSAAQAPVPVSAPVHVAEVRACLPSRPRLVSTLTQDLADILASRSPSPVSAPPPVAPALASITAPKPISARKTLTPTPTSKPISRPMTPPMPLKRAASPLSAWFDAQVDPDNDMEMDVEMDVHMDVGLDINEEHLVDEEPVAGLCRQYTPLSAPAPASAPATFLVPASTPKIARTLTKSCSPEFDLSPAKSSPLSTPSSSRHSSPALVQENFEEPVKMEAVEEEMAEETMTQVKKPVSKRKSMGGAARPGTGPARKKRRPSFADEHQHAGANDGDSLPTVATDNIDGMDAELIADVGPLPKAKRSRKKSTASDSAPFDHANTSSRSRSTSSSPLASSPSEVIFPADRTYNALELLGLVIQTLALARASSLTLAELTSALVRTNDTFSDLSPAAQSPLSIDCAALLAAGRRVGVFGLVSPPKGGGRHVKDRFFYVPDADDDRERAGLMSAAMPARRAEARRPKRYYWKPLGKISRWDAEDAI